MLRNVEKMLHCRGTRCRNVETTVEELGVGMQKKWYTLEEQGVGKMLQCRGTRCWNVEELGASERIVKNYVYKIALLQRNYVEECRENYRGNR